jgi:hypothetical protein
MLLSRYLKSLALLLLLPVAWFLSFFPLLMVWPHVQWQHLVPAVLAWAALYLLPLPFFLRLILNQVWFFPGKGEPCLQEMLEFLLLGIHSLPNPVAAEQKRGRILLRWHCEDTYWGPLMFRAGLKTNYELSLEFDRPTRTVIMRDRIRPVQFSFHPFKVGASLFSAVRFFCHIQSDYPTGIHYFDQISAETYSFRPQELKSPIFCTILQNGWNVRFALY